MICCINILPVLLLKTQETPRPQRWTHVYKRSQTIAQSVARMGVLGLHKLVDAVCGRYGLSAKHVQLLRNKGAGGTLFDLTSSSFLNAVRRMLTLLGPQGCKQVHFEGVQGWKGPPRLRQPARLLASSWQQVNGNPLHSSGICQADEISVSAVLEVVCAEDED